MAIQLRRSAGWSATGSGSRPASPFDDLTAGRTAAYAAEGLLEDDGVAVRLTCRGRCLADALVVKLVWG